MGKATDTLDLGSWCILRMASADTLKVYRSLEGAGLTVWTPIERRVGRMPRTRSEYDKEFALLPSYAFGSVHNLPELLRLAMVPNRDHPPFSVFRHQCGGVPLIGDDQLDALRGEESRVQRIFDKLKRRGKKGPKLEAGSEIRGPEGPFEGLSGIVEGQQGQYTLVSFAGFHKPIQIASILLLEEVEQAKAA